MTRCQKCERELEADEIALYMKMINRGAEEFMCIDCLAAELSTSREHLEKRIVQFRRAGCTLFK